MQMLMKEFASLLSSEVQELYFDADNDGDGNVFLNKMEDQPDAAVMVEWLGGRPDFPGSLYVSDFEVRFRGEDKDDSISGYPWAVEAHRGLHGWRRSPGYSGDIKLVLAVDLPYTIGYDEKNRPECILRFNVYTYGTLEL